MTPVQSWTWKGLLDFEDGAGFLDSWPDKIKASILTMTIMVFKMIQVTAMTVFMESNTVITVVVIKQMVAAYIPTVIPKKVSPKLFKEIAFFLCNSVYYDVILKCANKGQMIYFFC